MEDALVRRHLRLQLGLLAAELLDLLDDAVGNGAGGDAHGSRCDQRTGDGRRRTAVGTLAGEFGRR